jgi:leucyl-tRNA synthetase
MPSSAENADGPKTLRLYYASEFPEWQEKCMEALRTTWDDATNAFTGKERDAIAKAGLISDKRIMPFVSMIKRSIESVGVSGFDRRLLFDEKETLVETSEYIRRELSHLKIEKVEIVAKESFVKGSSPDDDVSKADPAIPGVPGYRLI